MDEDDERMGDVELLAPNAPPMTVEESVQAWGLSESLQKNLRKMGISEFFPVQRAV